MTGRRHQYRDAVARVAAAALLAVAGLAVSLVGVSPATAAPTTHPVGLPVTTDSARDDQWQLDKFDIRAAWQVSTGEGVTVAVIDSGVDGSHPDLKGQVLPGIDLVAAPDDPQVDPGPALPALGAVDGQNDPVGHGTTVAGLIAGRNDDKSGVVGLAPRAKILPVRVLDEENRYNDALIVAKGVRWAVDNGARVINLSLGGAGESPALAAALDYAFARDVVVVACTGNVGVSATNEVWYPAREPGVVAVAGMERDSDELWSGSITGRETVLTAPATGLLGARPGGVWRVQGTSFAAPLVAASAALVRSHWPEMSAGDVVNRLISTARDLGPPGRDDRFGFGMVNPVAALRGEVSTVNRNPLDDGAAAPGVAGFGPAPRTQPPGLTGVDPDQSGEVVPGSEARWVARAAGSPVGGSREGVLGGGALLVAVVTGSVLLVRLRCTVRWRRPGFAADLPPRPVEPRRR